jgi:predicted phosphoribosyltransferase
MVVLSQEEAGRRLARGLALAVRETPLVLALSPGGARVAGEIARVLGAPLDIIAATRLEVPGRPRSTFGAVADGAIVLLHDRIRTLGLPQDYVDGLIELARAEVDRVAASWRGHESALPLKNRTVILVDDGATDAVLVVGAATALRQSGIARLFFATPTASAELCQALRGVVDERIMLYEPEGPAATQVRDPSFAHTTEFDVHALVRRSRENAVVPTP